MCQEIPLALPNHEVNIFAGFSHQLLHAQGMFECNIYIYFHKNHPDFAKYFGGILFNKAITLWIWPTVVLGLHYCIRVGTL